VPDNVPGIHHVTAITGDVQKCTDFYVTVLGLRFIKKSINQDVPGTYHIYFGDSIGTPGTAMTFFGWPYLPPRQAGRGQVTVVAFAVPSSSLEFWTTRLRGMGIKAKRITRFGTDVIVLADVDGIELELVGEASDQRWVPWKDGPVDPSNAIRGFYSVTLTVGDAAPTANLLTTTMGFRQTGEETDRIRFETGAGGPDSTLDLIVAPDAPEGQETTGAVHHVAWRATDDAHQLAWRETLVKAGRRVTPVIDRWYFKSIYYREPGGVLFEIATDGPGFTVDESPEELGSTLSLPPWFGMDRDKLNKTLPPIVVPTTATKGAGH
jgi:glyoxalase family protein